MNNRIVYRKDGISTVRGENNMTLNFSGISLPPGIYLLNVLTEGEPGKTIKLMKVN